MPKARSDSDLVTIDDQIELGKKLSSGDLQPSSGEVYVMIDHAGKAREVPGDRVEQFIREGGRHLGDVDGDEAVQSLLREQEFGDTGGTLGAAALGVARTATLGASDFLVKKDLERGGLTPEEASAQLRGFSEENPIAETVGEIAGLALGGGGALIGKAGAAVRGTKLGLPGAFAVEGALFEGVQGVQELAETDLPLTSELVASTLWKHSTRGAALGGGLGVLGSGLSKLTTALTAPRFKPFDPKAKTFREGMKGINEATIRVRSLADDLIESAKTGESIRVNRTSLTGRLRQIDDFAQSLPKQPRDFVTARNRLRRMMDGDFVPKSGTSRVKLAKAVDDFEVAAARAADDAGLAGAWGVEVSRLPKGFTRELVSISEPQLARLRKRVSFNFSNEGLETFSRATPNKAIAAAKKLEDDLLEIANSSPSHALEFHSAIKDLNKNIRQLSGGAENAPSIDRLFSAIGLDDAAKQAASLGEVGQSMLGFYVKQRANWLQRGAASAAENKAATLGGALTTGLGIPGGPVGGAIAGAMIKKASQQLGGGALAKTAEKGMSFAAAIGNHVATVQSNVARATQRFMRNNIGRSKFMSGSAVSLFNAISGERHKDRQMSVLAAAEKLRALSGSREANMAEWDETDFPISMYNGELGVLSAQRKQAIIDHLAEHAPKEAFPEYGGKGSINRQQVDEFNSRVRAAEDPAGAIEHILGTGDPDPWMIDTIKELAPSLFQLVRAELLSNIDKADKLRFVRRNMLSEFFDIPLDPAYSDEYRQHKARAAMSTSQVRQQEQSNQESASTTRPRAVAAIKVEDTRLNRATE